MKRIIGDKELEGYLKLKDIYPDDYVLFEFSVVGLSEDRNVMLGKLSSIEKPYLDRLRLDLLVVDKDSRQAKLAVEIQSSFHSSDTQIFCDNLKKKILDIEKVKFIQIWTPQDWEQIQTIAKPVKTEEDVISIEEAKKRHKDISNKCSLDILDKKSVIDEIRELRVDLSRVRYAYEVSKDQKNENYCLLLLRDLNLLENDLF